jgi:hypothetical protein
VIESAFATVRLRQRVTKGAGSRTKGLLMAFKLLDMAQQRWRRLDGAALLPLVRAGVKFVDGVHKHTRSTAQSTEALQNFENGYPVHTRRFHGGGGDTYLRKPLRQTVQIGLKVLKVGSGLSSRSAGTATNCAVAPTSMPAADG